MASDLVVVGVARKTLLTPTAFDALFRVFFRDQEPLKPFFWSRVGRLRKPKIIRRPTKQNARMDEKSFRLDETVKNEWEYPRIYIRIRRFFRILADWGI